jgi:butyrate kinase
MQRLLQAHDILVINPGSTSTKLALFHGPSEVVSTSVTHSARELKRFASISGQLEFRIEVIDSFLAERNITSLAAVAGRGGLLRPLASGVYKVNKKMLRDLQAARYGSHASNLGALCAARIAERFSCPAYIADPVVVDELQDIARITGIPEIERRSLFHALNQKSSARAAAKTIGKKYESCNLIVAHIGGGISVGAHCKGKIIDVNNALDGDGPFSPERAGVIPVGDLVRLARKYRTRQDDLLKKIVGQGGLVAHCGTNNLQDIDKKIIAGDTRAALIFEAFGYGIAKEIAKHGATLFGKVDAIVLTGGCTYNRRLVAQIKKRVSFIAPIILIQGEREMESLAGNIAAVLSGERKALKY